jgi:hypothetical protein
MVPAPSPIGIDRLVLAATAALLLVPMITFVVQVDGSAAPVAPDDRQMTTINFDPHDHRLRRRTKEGKVRFVGASANKMSACSALMVMQLGGRIDSLSSMKLK